jgi:hypothetical protein
MSRQRLSDFMLKVKHILFELNVMEQFCLARSNFLCIYCMGTRTLTDEHTIVKGGENRV